jgi:hypothetical protein
VTAQIHAFDYLCPRRRLLPASSTSARSTLPAFGLLRRRMETYTLVAVGKGIVAALVVHYSVCKDFWLHVLHRFLHRSIFMNLNLCVLVFLSVYVSWCSSACAPPDASSSCCTSLFACRRSAAPVLKVPSEFIVYLHQMVRLIAYWLPFQLPALIHMHCHQF